LKKIIIIGVTFFLLVTALKIGEADIGKCTLYDLEGKEVRLSDFKGRPLILWFWTTWCPYCRKAIPELNTLYPELKQLGIELLAIDVDESKEKISRFLKYYTVDFNILQDRDGECALDSGVVGVPTYILVDKTGKIILKQNYFPKEEYKKLLSN